MSLWQPPLPRPMQQALWQDRAMSRHAPPRQWLATALLALCLLAVLLALRASGQATESLGPQTLGVVGTEIWVADERGLLALDTQGQARAEQPFAALGIASVGSIVAVDAQRALLASRGSTELLLIDAVKLTPQRRIALQFPPDLADQANHTLWLASRSLKDGRFEIYASTGGNHAVLRFDDTGQLLARTEPGLYEFTNGLWLTPEGLWTTDTNRFRLRLLDPDSLTQREELPLSALSKQRFLGAGIASRGQESPRYRPAVATLIRLQNGMQIGRIVDVFSDATEADYPLPALAEPLDIAWHGRELLVIESQQGRILRFSAARQPLGEFGSDILRLRFEQARNARDTANHAYYAWLLLAAISFLSALLLLQGARRASPAARDRQPGLPVPDRRTILLPLLRLLWPIPFLALLVLALRQPPGQAALKRALEALQVSDAPWLAASIALSLLLPFASWTLGRLRRFLLDPQMEPLYAREALVWLRDAAAWRNVMGPAETPRDIAACLHPLRGMLLLTNHRLLLFRASLSDDGAEQDWMRADIRRLQFDDPEHDSLWRFLLITLRGLPCTLQLRDGGVEHFNLRSIHATRRLQLQLLRGSGSEIPRSAPPVTATSPARGSLAQQILASALIPGGGQWMQRRNTAALIHFLYAAALLAFTAAPILWTWLTGHAALSPRTLVHALLAWLLLCACSALEAWQQQRRDARQTRKGPRT